MFHRIGERTILLGPRQSFWLGRIVISQVMYFVPLMQPPQRFQRSDLPTPIGGVQEIGFHPEEFHELAKSQMCGAL